MEKGFYDYDSMSFCYDNYDNDIELWRDVAKFQQMLMTNGYECVVRQEEHIVVIVEYNHDSYKGYGNATAHWVDDDTWNEMLYLHEEHEYPNEDDDE